MSPFSARRQLSVAPVSLGMDDFSHQQHFHSSPLLGGSDDLDTESWHLHRDPEAESVRSHPSSHHTADQSLLHSSAAPQPPSIPRPQPQRLQRRNHYHYINGVLVPTSPSEVREIQYQQQHLLIQPSRIHQHRTENTFNNSTSDNNLHKRSKSYSASGGGWLLGSASALVAESKRSSWTGERREIRKLQKEHPVGSARPTFALEIGEGEDDQNNASGLRRNGSVLAVKRRMERLRGLYRKGDKEVVSGWSPSRQ